MSAPLYTTADRYPTTPIQTFPPPLPTDQQPLRVRCGVTMRLHLTTHGLSPMAPSWPSPKGHVQPHRAHLPRRRNPRRIVLHEHEEDSGADIIKEPKAELPAAAVEVADKGGEEVVGEEAKPQPASGRHVHPHRNNLPRRRNPRRIVIHDSDEDRQADVSSEAKEPAEAITVEDVFAPAPAVDQPELQEIIPGLFIAFVSTSNSLEQLPGHTAEEPYTHIVNISHGDNVGASERVMEGRAQRLRLTLPPRDEGAPRAGLGLIDAQLRAARDFLAESQPHLPTDKPAGIRMLITTPHQYPTNAMCVLACYLAFVSGKQVEGVLRWIDGEEDYLSAWKGEVSEDETEKVEKIARAWSWLSNIVRPNIS
jgi:hypothetical protein